MSGDYTQRTISKALAGMYPPEYNLSGNFKRFRYL